MKQRIQGSRAYIKRTVDEILTTDGSARMVALSFALGTFLALLPTFGFAVFIGMLLLIAFPRLHKPGLLMAFVLWNPIMQIPLYSLSILIGSHLFSGMPIMSFDFALLDHVYNITRRVLIGNLIVTTVVSLISYCVVFTAIRKAKGRSVFEN